MAEMLVTEKVTLGVATLQTKSTLSSPQGRISQVDMPAAAAGTLSLRTSDSVGQVTLSDALSFTNGDIVDIYHASGICCSYVVSGWTGGILSITAKDANSAALPALNSSVKVCKQTILAVNIAAESLLRVAMILPDGQGAFTFVLDNGGTNPHIHFLPGQNKITILNPDSIGDGTGATINDTVLELIEKGAAFLSVRASHPNLVAWDCTVIFQLSAPTAAVPHVPPQVEPLAFSDETGTYNDVVQLQISTATVGASIYYTTDNSDPASSGTRILYTGIFGVGEDGNGAKIIRAVAEKAGMSRSEEKTATFTIDIAVSTPYAVTIGPSINYGNTVETTITGVNGEVSAVEFQYHDSSWLDSPGHSTISQSGNQISLNVLNISGMFQFRFRYTNQYGTSDWFDNSDFMELGSVSVNACNGIQANGALVDVEYPGENSSAWSYNNTDYYQLNILLPSNLPTPLFPGLEVRLVSNVLGNVTTITGQPGDPVLLPGRSDYAVNDYIYADILFNSSLVDSSTALPFDVPLCPVTNGSLMYAVTDESSLWESSVGWTDPTDATGIDNIGWEFNYELGAQSDSETLGTGSAYAGNSEVVTVNSSAQWRVHTYGSYNRSYREVVDGVFDPY